MLWTEAEGTVTANSQEIRGEGGEPNLPRLVRGLSVSVANYTSNLEAFFETIEQS